MNAREMLRAHTETGEPPLHEILRAMRGNGLPGEVHGVLDVVVARWRKLGRPPGCSDFDVKAYEKIKYQFGGLRKARLWAARLWPELEELRAVCPHCGRRGFNGPRGFSSHVRQCPERGEG